MPAPNHKSVGIDLKTYTKLKKICEDEHRNIRQQISLLVSEAYKEKYGESAIGGIGSITQKNRI